MNSLDRGLSAGQSFKDSGHRGQIQNHFWSSIFGVSVKCLKNYWMVCCEITVGLNISSSATIWVQHLVWFNISVGSILHSSPLSIHHFFSSAREQSDSGRNIIIKLKCSGHLDHPVCWPPSGLWIFCQQPNQFVPRCDGHIWIFCVPSWLKDKNVVFMH